MLIVDTALQKRIAENNPIKVAIIGAGYSGKNVAHQIIKYFPSMQVACIANRTLENAAKALAFAGIGNFKEVHTAEDLSRAIENREFTITRDPHVLFQCPEIEAIVETTGTVDFGAQMAYQSIQAGKHTIVLNCEMDATVGPILKRYAEKKGVIYSNTDGDEPGVAMNLYRFVRTIGFEPVVAGNLKGFYDPYRTPETQKEFARKHDKDPRMMTSFVDGTKLSMELSVLANATGLKVIKRGMYGPKAESVQDALTHFPLREIQAKGGGVDFLLGAAPNTGAFVVCYNEDKPKMDYMKYLKMGDGPYYVFYTPFHLPHLEIPITIARAVLFKDATVSPKGKPVADVITVAKKDLHQGEVLDGIGGFTCYSLIEDADLSYANNFLPMGLSEGCILRRDVRKDEVITYDDVIMPDTREVDRLRDEQKKVFFQG